MHSIDEEIKKIIDASSEVTEQSDPTEDVSIDMDAEKLASTLEELASKLSIPSKQSSKEAKEDAAPEHAVVKRALIKKILANQQGASGGV